MFRVFFLIIAITVVGVAITTSIAPDHVGTFLFYFYSLIAVLTVIRFVFECSLNLLKSKQDKEDYTEILAQEEVDTYYDINDYSRARRDEKES